MRDIALTAELLAAVNQAHVELSFGRVLYVNGGAIVASEIRSAGITAEDIAWACVVIGSWAERLRAQFLAQFPPSPTDGSDKGPTLLN